MMYLHTALFPYDFRSCKRRHQYVFTNCRFIDTLLYFGDKCSYYDLNTKEKTDFFQKKIRSSSTNVDKISPFVELVFRITINLLLLSHQNK
jgi:hypothetical protein